MFSSLLYSKGSVIMSLVVALVGLLWRFLV